MEVVLLEQHPLAELAAATGLVRRGRADGRVDGEVRHLLLGLGPDVAAATVGGLGRRPLARLLAGGALSRQLDLADREEIGGIRARLRAARPAAGHALVGVRGLLPGIGLAGVL